MKLEAEDLKSLATLAASLPGSPRLTPAEIIETLRIAQGFACKDSAAAGNVSPETIRARRKRIYRKLGFAGSGELIAALLGASLSILARRAQPNVVSPDTAATRADAAAS